MPRADLRAMEGYHSPQVDVAVRLNTNESPEPPPAAWRDAFAARAVPRRLAPLPRPQRRRAAGGDRRAPRGRARSGLRRQRLERGAADRLAGLRRAGPHASRPSSPPTSCTATSPASPAPRWWRASGPPTSPSTSTRSAGSSASAEPGRHLPVLAQQPHRHGRRRRTSCARCSTWPPASSSSTRPTASSRRGRRSALVDDDRPLVVTRTFSKTWSMAAARLGYLVGPTWLVAELDKVVLPYHLDAAKQIAGRLALRFVDEMEARVKAVVEERERIAAALGELPGRRVALRRQLHPVPARGARRARRSGRGCSTASTCWCATARRGRGSRAACASRSAPPPRTTPSSTALRGGAGRREPRRPSPPAVDQGDHGRRHHRPRRHGSHRGVDRAAVLRPHARPARPPRRLRPHRRAPPATSHVDSHHTVEDTAIVLGEAFGEALGDKAGVRRFASGLYPLDEALVEVALDLSGRPFVVWDVELPEAMPLGDPPFDPSLAEHAMAHRFATAAGITLHVTLRRGRNVHHIIEATFKGLARCLPRRRARRGRRRARAPRACCDRPTEPLVACSTTASATCARPRRRWSASAPTPVSPPIDGVIADAAGVVLPGVGAFGACCRGAARPPGSRRSPSSRGVGPAVPRHLHRHAAAVRALRGGRRRHGPRRDPRAPCAGSRPA